jgi:hypothetical protein
MISVNLIVWMSELIENVWKKEIRERGKGGGRERKSGKH